MVETQPGERQSDGAGVYNRFPARREPRVHPGERAAERELEVEGGVDDHRQEGEQRDERPEIGDRKSTRLNSSHDQISYAVFCLKKKKKKTEITRCRGMLGE